MDRNLPTVLITGASSGIGRDLARVFGENHFQLILVARDRTRLESIASEIHQNHLAPVRIEVCDLANSGAIDGLVERLRAENTVVDVLVNNAGFGVEGKFLETDWSAEREMLEVNVNALVRLTKEFLPQMVRRGSGRILQVASTAAFQPGPYLALYFATKALVLAFSEALAIELRGTGVTVTTLCPGPTRTGFEARLGPDSRIFTSGLPVANSRAVATYAYASLMRGKRVAIHGFLNRLLAQVSKHMPRTVVVLFMGWVIGRKRKRESRPTHSKNFPAA
jgi:short-subunit dehydrogenase